MNDRTLRVLDFNKIISMLVSFSVSEQGRELCQNIAPLAEIKAVQLLLDQTGEAEALLFRMGASPVTSFDDVRQAIARARIASVLSMGELLKLARFLKVVRLAHNSIVGDEENNHKLLVQYARQLTPLRPIEEEIFRCIVSEDEMQDDASHELSLIRRQIRSCHSKIKEKLNSLVRSLEQSKVLQESIITVRNDRYVLPVRAEHKSSVAGIVHDQSSTGATLFIEPMAVVEINNQLRELMLKENEEIERILSSFTAQVAEYVDVLSVNSQVLAELDYIFSRAKLSREMKASVPKLNNNGYLNIKGGRHPLLDKKTAVPISVWLGKDFTQLLITGPNTGGKTVTLKTIGLFALMTQAGLFIPADFGSEMTVFDNIFADIGDEQSIEQSLSTFSSHMKNIAVIMQKLTPNSLVLLDELGAGTDPTEGAALAMSILEELRQRKIRTVVTTHYSELKAYSISNEGAENASVEFDVVSLRPTYKLLVGVPGSSNAFLISGRLGLEQYLIDRARSYISEESMRLEDVFHQAEQYRRSAELESKEVNLLKAEAEELRRNAEKAQQSLEKQKEQLMLQAKAEAQKLIEDARTQADKIIDEMKHLQKDSTTGGLLFDARAKRKELEKKLGEYSVQPTQSQHEPIDQLKPGDSVYIISLNQIGSVLTLPNAKGELKVQAGIMQLDVNKNNIAKAPEPPKPALSSQKVTRSQKNVGLSIDVRGQNADEAIMNIDYYLDEAYSANYNEVTIIHGKGTGVLRAAVSEYLKNRHHIKSFRAGRYGEGEQGVTVVQLN